jgi:hypothetical protein
MRHDDASMGTCHIALERIQTGAAGSPLLGRYCQARRLNSPAAFEQLPPADRERIERELEALVDLSGPLGNAHLLDTFAGHGDAPDVPRGVPLALWFLLHQPDLFWQVHRNHLHRDLDVWRAARVEVRDQSYIPADCADRLAAELGRLHQEDGWHVARHELATGLALLATRPAATVLPTGDLSDRPLASDRLEFAYHPQAGTLLMQPGLGPEEAVQTLLNAFADAVEAGPLLPGPAFDVDRLRWPFRPQPDELGLEVRLKTLHLRYPEREGKRMVTLDTLESDMPQAVEEMVGRHVPADILPELAVHQAALLARLQTDGGERLHQFRLYPNYCDLGRGRLGERLLACVRRWGL